MLKLPRSNHGLVGELAGWGTLVAVVQTAEFVLAVHSTFAGSRKNTVSYWLRGKVQTNTVGSRGENQ